MNYYEKYLELEKIANLCSENEDLDGLSQSLMDFSTLGSAISEPMLLAKTNDKDEYRAYQRLDKDIGRKMNAIRSRLSAIKAEKDYMRAQT